MFPLRYALPCLFFTLAHSVSAASHDWLGRCGKECLMPSGGKEYPGRKYARDRLVDIQNLALEVTPDFTKRTVSGTVTISFTPIASPLPSLELDAVSLTIEEVGATGAIVTDHSNTGEKLRVTFKEPVLPDQPVTLKVRFYVQPDRGFLFRTPEMGYPEGDTQAWSQGEAEYHRYWFPCYDFPNERFTSEIICHAPPEMQVISNGRLLSKSPDAAGLTAWHWKQETPHVNYLIALAAGYFHKIEASAGGVPMALYVPPSEKAQAELAFQDTAKIMEFYQKETGVPFPWVKYDQVYCHDFLAGGMENTSATFMAASMLYPAEAERLDTVHRLDAHELAHQWFGDLVTCRDWSHLWLNEGFASYYTVLYEEQKNGREGMLYSLHKEAQRVLDKVDPRPMVWKDYGEPMQQFDDRAYPRGAWVLHMLRSQLGPDLFRKCITAYLQRHRNGIVSTDDLQDVLEDLSGRSFDQFFDQWVHHGGFPNLKASYEWDAAQKQARVNVRQTQKVDEKIPMFRFPLPIRFHYTGADGKAEIMNVSATVSGAEETFSFTLPAQPTLMRLDPDYTVLAKWEFTPPPPMLEEQLKADYFSRLLAVGILKERKDHVSVEKLTALLMNDPEHTIRRAAADALGQAGTDEARKALSNALTQEDERVRSAAVNALAGQWHPGAHAALTALSAVEKNPVILTDIINSWGAWPAADVLPWLTRPSYHGMIAAAAVKAARGQFRQEASAGIRSLLEQKPRVLDARDAAAALDTLAFLSQDSKDTSLQPFIASYVSDTRPDLATAAVRALGTLGDPRSTGLLRTASDNKSWPRLAAAATEALNRIQTPNEVPAQVKEAFGKMEALQRTTDELKQKLADLEKKSK